MWKDATVREIAVVLVIKLIMLYGIWMTFFHHPDERELTPHEIGHLLLDSSHQAAFNPFITNVATQE